MLLILMSNPAMVAFGVHLINMSTLKTRLNDSSVDVFINNVPDEIKKQDSLTLIKVLSKITGEPAKMWGSSIVGFGKYHYKSERSSQEGDWPLVGFSPRKQNLTIYIMTGFKDYRDLLKELGKHTTSVGCLYIKKLADIDMKILQKLIARCYADMKKTYLNN